jgi:hypothetical protein
MAATHKFNHNDIVFLGKYREKRLVLIEGLVSDGAFSTTTATDYETWIIFSDNDLEMEGREAKWMVMSLDQDAELAIKVPHEAIPFIFEYSGKIPGGFRENHLG